MSIPPPEASVRGLGLWFAKLGEPPGARRSRRDQLACSSTHMHRLSRAVIRAVPPPSHRGRNRSETQNRIRASSGPRHRRIRSSNQRICVHATIAWDSRVPKENPASILLCQTATCCPSFSCRSIQSFARPAMMRDGATEYAEGVDIVAPVIPLRRASFSCTHAKQMAVLALCDVSNNSEHTGLAFTLKS